MGAGKDKPVETEAEELAAIDEVESGDRLPWLETADEDYEEKPPIARTALLVLAGLVVIAAAIGGWWRVPGNGGGAGGRGPVGRCRPPASRAGGRRGRRRRG